MNRMFLAPRRPSARGSSARTCISRPRKLKLLTSPAAVKVRAALRLQTSASAPATMVTTSEHRTTRLDMTASSSSLPPRPPKNRVRPACSGRPAPSPASPPVRVTVFLVGIQALDHLVHVVEACHDAEEPSDQGAGVRRVEPASDHPAGQEAERRGDREHEAYGGDIEQAARQAHSRHLGGCAAERQKPWWHDPRHQRTTPCASHRAHGWK